MGKMCRHDRGTAKVGGLLERHAVAHGARLTFQDRDFTGGCLQARHEALHTLIGAEYPSGSLLIAPAGSPLSNWSRKPDGDSYARKTRFDPLKIGSAYERPATLTTTVTPSFDPLKIGSAYELMTNDDVRKLKVLTP